MEGNKKIRRRFSITYANERMKHFEIIVDNKPEVINI